MACVIIVVECLIVQHADFEAATEYVAFCISGIIAWLNVLKAFDKYMNCQTKSKSVPRTFI